MSEERDRLRRVCDYWESPEAALRQLDEPEVAADIRAVLSALEAAEAENAALREELAEVKRVRTVWYDKYDRAASDLIDAHESGLTLTAENAALRAEVEREQRAHLATCEKLSESRAREARLREAAQEVCSWVSDVLQGWQAHAQIAAGKGGGMGANILQESAARYGSRYHWMRVEKALGALRAALASGEESRCRNCRMVFGEMDPVGDLCADCAPQRCPHGPCAECGDDVPSACGEESRPERCPYCAKSIGNGDAETCDSLCHRGGDDCRCEERSRLIREWAQYEPCDDRAKALEAQIDRLSGYDGDTPKDWRGESRAEEPGR